MSRSKQCFTARGLTSHLLLLVGSIFCKVSLADTETLWELVDPGQYLGDLAGISLPEQVDTQRAVYLSGSLFDGLLANDTLTVEIADQQAFNYVIEQRSDYLNGDSGWRAGFSNQDQSFGISLTYNSQVILATIFSPTGKYSLQAIPLQNSDDYIGWVYSFAREAQYLPIDDGAYISSGSPGSNALMDFVALSGNDVSVVQTLTSSGGDSGTQINATIGDILTVSIRITNNLSSTLINEEVNILFILDETDFISSSTGCEAGSTGVQPSVQCTIDGLAPGTSTTLDYTVQLTDVSYPQVASGVFVGDLSGEYVQQNAFVFVNKETLEDTDGDGITDFNEGIANTDPNSATSVVAPDFTSEVDLMFLYTQEFLDDIGHPSPQTEINQLVEVTNAYYANSGALVEFRPVYYEFVDYDVNNNLNVTHDALSDATDPAFESVSTNRSDVGADIVVLIDGKFESGNLCGLGSAGGLGYRGELFHPLIPDSELYTTLYMPGFPDGGGGGCDDLTLAHELGHNFGLGHSHREAGAEGTFSWSFGHGVDGSFATIMANPDNFPGSTELPLFSNPSNSQCNGLACGVSRTNTELGADAVHTLNHSRFQIAALRASRILDATSLSGESSLLMYGGATRTGDSDTAVSLFSPQDSIDVRASLQIPSEHQGLVGVTYVVISADGLGFFFRDDQGGYQAWDGEIGTLGGTIRPRALNSSEELVAFSEFVPSAFGVDSASLMVFFAYKVPSLGAFVYSTTGIAFSIQP